MEQETIKTPMDINLNKLGHMEGKKGQIKIRGTRKKYKKALMMYGRLLIAPKNRQNPPEIECCKLQINWTIPVKPVPASCGSATQIQPETHNKKHKKILHPQQVIEVTGKQYQFSAKCLKFSHYFFLLIFIWITLHSLRPRDKLSGGTTEFTFTSTYPQVSGTGEMPPYCTSTNLTLENMLPQQKPYLTAK